MSPNSFVVFKDDDTLVANANIDFVLLNDKAGIFRETCSRLQTNHTMSESTVFYCSKRFVLTFCSFYTSKCVFSNQLDLKYAKSGHFKDSPYCVVLQAREVIRGKQLTENATICIFTTSTSSAHGVEFLPNPEKLRDERNGNRNTKKITSSGTTSDESKVSSPLKFVVIFPDQAEVLQNASSFARVVEPTETSQESKIT